MSSLGDRRPLPDVDQADVDRFWAEVDASPESEDGTSVEEILDRNFFEAMTDYDPSARLDRWLSLRLHGQQVRSGRLDIGVAHELFQAFASELNGAAAAHSIKDPPRMELAGLSQGSAVLHLVPVLGEEERTSDQLPVAVDRLDSMLATITELHRIAEAGGNLGQFAGDEQLLRGLRELIRTLEKNDLNLDVRWRGGSGQHRTSSLTARARQHVRAVWEEEVRTATTRISGRVITLDLGGTFDVKTSWNRAKRYHIHMPEGSDILDLHLSLGETVSVQIKEIQRVRKVGLTTEPRYEFEVLLNQGEPID